MDMVKINFIPNRIKYILYEKIKATVFENHGIIFGGFVRDMIVSDHYKTLYNHSCKNNTHNIHQFWNRFYQPETSLRAIVAKDMDICMYREEDVYAFIVALQGLFNEEIGFGNVSSSDFTTTNENEHENSYHGIAIKMHKKLIYKAIVGKIPYVHSGVELSFEFDIVIPSNANIQPPFYKTDLLANVFILSKQGVVMSNHTGTCIDNMSILNRQKMSMKIMSDVVELKTQFCMRNYRNDYECGDFEYNKKVIERLRKMVFRDIPWEITNLPFLLEKYKVIKIEDKETKELKENKETCCICTSCLNNGEKVVKIMTYNSTKTEKVLCSIIHAHCCFKYFETQIETATSDWIGEDEQFEFRCPLRNTVNFKICSKNIDNIIGIKMMS
jgi:hypothetical protein